MTPLPVDIEYYTDPLCSWSWAFEPQWRRLLEEHGPVFSWRYRMSGMIPDWSNYSDPLNSINRPAQMAPQWFHVKSLTGAPLDETIWTVDPPASSYPACLAVKAAERQGPEWGDRYLRRLREAVMLERCNIARPEGLLAAAEEVEGQSGGAFSVSQFELDLEAPETHAAFREDLMQVRYLRIGRFPSLVLRRPGARSLLLTGYRPYEALRAALEHLAPELKARAELLSAST